MTAAPTLAKRYIEQCDRGYWIEGTRISLDSVGYAFLNGKSPERIAQDFPLLSLEQVYSGFQMSVYSFENKKSVPLRVLSFHFAGGKLKTPIWCDRLLSWQPQVS
ncbi:MAG: DUF433 domain-containing protein [Pseudanabaena sp.]